jgi:superfamily II DNA or RNA helicase
MDSVRSEYRDDVFMRVDCEEDVAMELSEFFTFEVPGFKYMPAYRHGSWDGKIRLFDSRTHRLYAGLESYLVRFCEEREYEYVQGPEFARDEPDVEAAGEFIESLGLPHVPRDYQVAAHAQAYADRRCVIVSPTASGKSLVIYTLFRRFGGKTLVVVPTTSLVEQMAGDFLDYGYDGECHLIYSGKEKDNPDAEVIVSTWQSIFKMPASWFAQFDTVIGDEAHLFKAKSLTGIMEKMTGVKNRVGLTGTLDGSQCHRLVLEGLFGPVRRVTTTAELMRQGHVAQLKINAIVLEYPDDARLHCSKLDYQAEMDLLCSYRARNRFLTNLVSHLEGNTLVLFQFVEKHGKVLREMIETQLEHKHVLYIDGSVGAEEREAIRAEVARRNDIVLIASFGTTSTGINAPNLHNLVFASPSKSKIRNLQSIGRGLRLAEGKDTAFLYDVADDLTWNKRRNFTLNHAAERMKTYLAEGFDVEFHRYPLAR